MGIRGLTTFISNFATDYLTAHELCNTYLVVDGNNIAMQLYNWHCNCYDSFGGDYDKYAFKVTEVFTLFTECNITPLIIFDGGCESRKQKTHYDRLLSKITNAKKLTNVLEGSVRVSPLFIRQIFVDLMLEMQIKVVRCDFEADSELVSIATFLNCPILSYDSDFYLSDVMYIPFSTLDIKLCKGQNKDGSKYNFISCQLFNREAFLHSFKGLQKNLLPLIGVLLGNDYINASLFESFYANIKVEKKKYLQSYTQRRIYSVLKWLQNETYNSALNKILLRCKANSRTRILVDIKAAQKGYLIQESQVLKYLHLQEYDNENSFINENCPNLFSGEMISICEDHVQDKSCVMKLPVIFLDAYRKGLYPAIFMDIIFKNKYFISPQLEDYNNDPADFISKNIIGAIFTILTSNEISSMQLVARSAGTVTSYVINKSSKFLPNLLGVTRLSREDSTKVMLNILDFKVQTLTILNNFPYSWSLYLLSIKYWTIHSNIVVTKAHVYSLILCLLILNIIDKKIGMRRSLKAHLSDCDNVVHSKSIDDSNDNDSILPITKIDAKTCMKELVKYFHMDPKLLQNNKLYNIKLIHSYSQFQSGLLHITYLNSLLNRPFNNIIISEFYNGTFVYNVCLNLMKRKSIDNYMKLILHNSPTALKAFLHISGVICSELNLDEKIVNVKKKKRKRHLIHHETEDTIHDEEIYEKLLLDPNNRYTMLQEEFN